MSTISKDPASWKGILSDLARQVESKIAPLIAPYMPERYYELYRRSLTAMAGHLPVLQGLPAGSVEEGYVPLLLSAPDNLSTQSIWDALAQSPNLLICGPVGSGKTTLLHMLAWEFANRPDPAFIRRLTFKWLGQDAEDQDVVPVWLDLQQFEQDKKPFFDTLLDTLAYRGFPSAREFLRQHLEAGRCILLLDGLERVRDSSKQAQLAEAIATFSRNLWVVTMRLEAFSPSFPRFSTLRLKGIASADVSSFVQYYLGTHAVEMNGLLAACERSASLAQLAETPLMIAAMSRLFCQKTVPAIQLRVLYDACLETLLEEWGTGEHVRSRYALEDKLQILRYIAYSMQWQESATLPRDELLRLIQEQLAGAKLAPADDLWEEFTARTGILCPVTVGSQVYGFLAPALQSYLAAQWIVATQQSHALLPLVDNLWWHDTLILVAGLLPDPIPFLQGVALQGQQEPYKWFLLGDCLAELAECDDALRTQTTAHLFALLEGEDAEHWQTAATTIAGIAREQTKEHFMSLAHHPDGEMRRKAVLTLGRLRQEWAIPALGAAVGDAEPRVRQQAAWALGYIPSSHTIRILSRALRSPFTGVREAGAQSLAMLAHFPELLRPATQELITGLDESEEIARSAEHALAEVGPSATPQLITALSDRRLSQSQRSHAAKALGRLGEEQALPVLIEALVSGKAEDTEGYIDAVAGIKGKAVPALIAALQGKDTTSGASLVAALIRIGAPAVESLIAAIAGTFPEVRNASVRALEQIGAPAVEPLTYALLHDSHFEIRRVALEILGRIGESQVVAALVGALDDPDPGVRINAVRYLGKLADKDGVLPLIKILHARDDLAEIKAIISSLAAIGDVRAIPPLLEELQKPALGESAMNALSEFGSAVVEPAIRTLHTPETSPEVREAVWGVLTNVGARARPDDRNLVGLASAYTRLHDANASLEELLSIAERLDWWTHGAEIHESLATGYALVSAQTLEKISECGPSFEWLADQPTWYRPHVKDILWGLKDVVENIRLYRTLTRRETQRDALLSAVDKLSERQQWAQKTALPFEQAFFDRVIVQWRAAILEAIKQLRGRAALFIQLLTPSLPLRPSQHQTTAAFSIFNKGDSAARNLSVTLQSGFRGVEVVGGEHRKLEPLGMGEQRQVEIAIAPNGARQADMAFEVTYDDDEREGANDRFSFHIDFWDAPSIYTPIKSSPYVAGAPVKNAEMFFGRQDIFAWVRDNISSEHQENPLVLYGERRMGKTSVLYHLLQEPPTPRHITLLFDLQLYSYLNTATELLLEMALAITTRLGQEGIIVAEPDEEQYSANPYRTFLAFCSALDSLLGERRVVVMLDEFGVLMAKVRDHIINADIFNFLRGIIQRTNKLNFLFAGAYEVRRMQQDYDSILFNLARVHKITYLEPGEAEDLIQKPVDGLLAYHPLVIEKIKAVTACHPYFVQYICDELVQLARSERKNYIELSDLDYVIREVVHDATGNIENSIYNYLGNSEKLALAALANTTDDVRVFVPLSDVAGMLERRHLGIPRDELMQALKALEERDLVTEMRIGQQLRYAFRMGLVRMWLAQNEILLRLSQEKEA